MAARPPSSACSRRSPRSARRERRRALVIVNPHATARLRPPAQPRRSTRSRRATRSRRSRPQRRGHATEIAPRRPRARATTLVIAFGGDGTVNEAANGLAGSGVPLTCLPGGSANVFCKLLGIPGEIVDATEHLLRVADRFAPRAGRPRRSSRGATTPSAPASASTPTSCARVDARPRAEGALRAVLLLRRRRRRCSPAATWCAPPRMFVSVGGETLRRRHDRRAERRALHLLPRPPDRPRRGRRARRRHARRRRAAARERARRARR